jgi:hypothetical protein
MINSKQHVQHHQDVLCHMAFGTSNILAWRASWQFCDAEVARSASRCQLKLAAGNSATRMLSLSFAMFSRTVYLTR